MHLNDQRDGKDLYSVTTYFYYINAVLFFFYLSENPESCRNCFLSDIASKFHNKLQRNGK